MIDPGLQGKVVLITGANNPHGIGAATARAFAAQGAAIALTYHRASAEGVVDPGEPGEAHYLAAQAGDASALVNEFRAAGGQAEAWAADLGDSDLIPALFDRVEAALGPVDVLVNNAANWEGDTLLPATADPANPLPELWTGRSPPISAALADRLFAVIGRGTALMMAEYARRQIARGAGWGRIINISTDGASGFPGEVSYGAAKHAMESYSRAAALEFAHHGITVNVVSLGPIQTGWISPALETAIIDSIPLGRLGRPEDVADVIVFLASEQARWLTGQLIYAGGGHLMPL